MDRDYAEPHKEQVTGFAQLADIANMVENYNIRLNGFVERYNGNSDMPQSPASNTLVSAVPSYYGYEGQLRRINDLLGETGRLVCEIHRIG